LGYYQRARNFHRAAGQLCRFHDCRLPPDYESLRKLPGFGPYTTAAVLSIAFDKPHPLIDANVRRVAMRLLGIREKIGPSADKKILPFLESVLPSHGAGDFNQALMELGALVCRSSMPACSVCPVVRYCRAYAEDLQDVLPVVPVKKIKKIRAVVAVIRKGTRLFMQQRPAEGLLAGLWEFPGGNVEQNEGSRRALTRELKEELAVSVVSARYLFTVRHAYTHFRVTLEVWACDVAPLPRVNKKHRWVTVRNLKNLTVPSATQQILTRLRMS
jgi:A/G-specific adenine glycosylase